VKASIGRDNFYGRMLINAYLPTTEQKSLVNLFASITARFLTLSLKIQLK